MPKNAIGGILIPIDRLLNKVLNLDKVTITGTKYDAAKKQLIVTFVYDAGSLEKEEVEIK